MSRNPAVEAIFHPTTRRTSIHRSQPAPDSTEFRQHAVHCRGAAPLAPCGVHRPHLRIYLGTGQAVWPDEIRSLIGKHQHPAGFVARLYPPRPARSKVSSAIKEDNQTCRHVPCVPDDKRMRKIVCQAEGKVKSRASLAGAFVGVRLALESSVTCRRHDSVGL